MVDPYIDVSLDRRWRGQKQPIPVVISVIRRDAPDTGQKTAYLLIRRNSGPYRDQWALVGGKWDFGETLADAAVREVREETGLESDFDGLLGVVNERVRIDQSGKKGAAHFLIFVCQLRAVFGEAQEQEEGVVAWFTAPQIDELKDAGAIIPSDYAMLNSFVAGESLPVYEIEMISADGEEGAIRLTRFELVD